MDLLPVIVFLTAFYLLSGIFFALFLIHATQRLFSFIEWVIVIFFWPFFLCLAFIDLILSWFGVNPDDYEDIL